MGIRDIVWSAGDISNIQYTGIRDAIRTAFSMGQIEKLAVTVTGSSDYRGVARICGIRKISIRRIEILNCTFALESRYQIDT
jgi:hypothetical protein